MSDDLDTRFRKAAIELHWVDGEVEIDDAAEVSRSDDEQGAYVQAWVWVPTYELDKAAEGVRRESS